ncbi:MAG: hypothetical protein R2734_18350 [Nocardioides sp.]
MAYELKDLLVSMRLPGEEELKPPTPATGFSPEAQAELQVKLARCEAMLVENEVTSRTARTGRRVK